jgi:excisionase family DNA binding protein
MSSSTMATILTELLTLESTAKYLRLSPETILRQVENGHLPAQRNGDRWQFLRSDLDTWSDGLRPTLGHRYDQRKVLLKQAGALAHDDTIDEMQRLIDLRRQQSSLEMTD